MNIEALFKAGKVKSITIVFRNGDERPETITEKDIPHEKPYAGKEHLALYVENLLFSGGRVTNNLVADYYKKTQGVRKGRDLLLSALVISWGDLLTDKEVRTLAKAWRHGLPGTSPPPDPTTPD